VKLVTFRDRSGAQRIGSVLDDRNSVADFRAGEQALWHETAPAFDSMLSLIQGGAEARTRAETVATAVASGRADAARRSMAEIRLLAPLPRPEQMRNFLYFELHYK